MTHVLWFLLIITNLGGVLDAHVMTDEKNQPMVLMSQRSCDEQGNKEWARIKDTPEATGGQVTLKCIGVEHGMIR